MYRRADRVWRHEQHPQAIRCRQLHFEAIAEIAAKRPAESLGVADSGKRERAAPRLDRARQLEECPPDGAQIRSQWDLAEEDREHRAAPGEEEVAAQTRKL